MGEKEEAEEIAKILTSLAATLREKGFPKEPFIVQTEPGEDFCLFICLWRNTGDRKTGTLQV